MSPKSNYFRPLSLINKVFKTRQIGSGKIEVTFQQLGNLTKRIKNMSTMEPWNTNLVIRDNFHKFTRKDYILLEEKKCYLFSRELPTKE